MSTMNLRIEALHAIFNLNTRLFVKSHHIGQLAYLRRYFGLPSLDWR
jgi:hypothetical protein